MRKNDTRNYADFLRQYQVDRDESKPRRLKAFLESGAEDLPHEFFPREVIAQVIFDLKAVPDREDYVVRHELAAAVRAARPLLETQKPVRYIVSNRRGMRATVDDTDAAETVLRASRVRAKKAVDRCHDLHESVNISNIRGRELRQEVSVQKKSVRGLQAASTKLFFPAPPKI
jgi:hypothetical protein